MEKKQHENKESVKTTRFPHTELKNKKHVPLLTVQNTFCLLENYRGGVEVYHDEISKDDMLVADGIARPLTNEDVIDLWSYAHFCGYKLTKGATLDHLSLIAKQNSKNLVQAYFEELLGRPDISELVREGKKARDLLVESLAFDEDYDINPEVLRSYARECLSNWLFNCVRMACNNDRRNFNVREILVLQGPQKIGKTEFIKRIIPEPLLPYFKGSMQIDPKDKDHVAFVNKYWIVEFAEFDTMGKQDQGRLKAFITGDTDIVRLAYEAKAAVYKRHFCPYATVNDSQFLTDKTGNSRYMVLPIVSIDFETTAKVDREALWAYAAKMVYTFLDNPNQKFTLSKDMMGIQETINGEATVPDPTYQALVTSYDWNFPKDEIRHRTSLAGDTYEVRWSWMQGEEIVKHCKLKTTKGLKESVKKVGSRYQPVDYKRTNKGAFYYMPPKVYS